MIFEAVGGQQVPPGDLIRELEELSLTKLPSPAPSDSNSWGSAATGTSTPDDSLLIVGPHSPPPADHGEYCDMWTTEQHNSGSDSDSGIQYVCSCKGQIYWIIVLIWVFIWFTNLFNFGLF